MSQVIKFWEKIDHEESLLKMFSGLSSNEQIVEFASSIGFEFTIDEYSKELESSLDLDNIVGGASNLSGPAQCPTGWPTSISK